eukprot:6435818-Amphidinium_carterae.1
MQRGVSFGSFAHWFVLFWGVMERFPSFCVQLPQCYSQEGVYRVSGAKTAPAGGHEWEQVSGYLVTISESLTSRGFGSYCWEAGKS